MLVNNELDVKIVTKTCCSYIYDKRYNMILSENIFQNVQDLQKGDIKHTAKNGFEENLFYSPEMTRPESMSSQAEAENSCVFMFLIQPSRD